jgi:CO dehydrogenase nickel-insertion accessory protein CooC1
VSKPLSGSRIGIVGKGGAGKSTASVLLSRALAQLGYRVWILDADSTNVGLHSALGLDACPESLVDYFGGTVFRGGSVGCPVDDPRPLAGARLQPDDLPPQYRGESAEGISLVVAGKLGAMGTGAGCDGPIGKIARDLSIEDPQGDSVMLIDFKAGFEDSARGVITSLDRLLVMVDPTGASLQLAVDMKQLVDAIRGGTAPATAHLHQPELVEAALQQYRDSALRGMTCVLSRCADKQVATQLRQGLHQRELEPLGVIHEDAAIAQAWLKGERIEAPRAESDAWKVAHRLELIAEGSGTIRSSTRADESTPGSPAPG